MSFNFTIIACSEFIAEDIKTLKKLAGIHLPWDPSGDEEGNANLIPTKSFHLIGLEDDFKAKREEVANIFKGGQNYVSTRWALNRSQ